MGLDLECICINRQQGGTILGFKQSVDLKSTWIKINAYIIKKGGKKILGLKSNVDLKSEMSL